MLRILSLLLVLTMMSGCAGFTAQAIVDATELHQAVRDYAHENKNQRIWVRNECRKSVNIQMEKAREEKGELAVQQILRDNYPRLITIDILNSSLNKGEIDILSTPPSCGIDVGESRQ